MTTAASDKYKGYRNQGKAKLVEQGVEVWSDVEVDTTNGGHFRGLILPRSETADDLHIVLKLASGYNVGLRADKIASMRQVGYRAANYKIPEKDFPHDPGKPKVKLFGTGGTIASRLDYRTGAVIPAFSPGELYGSVPELADICNLETEKLFAVFSENMGPEQYITTAIRCGEAIEQGYSGIVIGHGTDTMHHTSAVLSFMVQNSPIPIVMVGSQRSSDRPSSDAARNLIHSTHAAAHGDIAEVLVCMFGPTSDNYNLLHRGTRVRKMHSSYRSTFRTLSATPLARVEGRKIETFTDDYNHRRADRKATVKAVFDDRVAIVYYYPNMKPDIIQSLMDNGYKGIIIAGTGLGHVNKPLYDVLGRACKAGIHVFMTVQTMWGFVQMYVYETGRELMQLGVVPASNMLPEVAYVKLGWVLGQTHEKDEVQRLMLTPVNREITDREPYNGYMILQGGIPEVEAALAKLWK
ncbi:MAG: Glu-tRNA(Gln) amidotransferase GatDE subunit D [Myxococcales bacterium]|nr:MAG: Glu-tRNA(Gln) amidotransferase GatDE subunit D [Myxococcales bacterium]